MRSSPLYSLGAAMPHRSQSLHQLRNRNAESLGDNLDVPQGNVAPATLDAADVGPVQTALGGEGLLRKPLRLPQLSQMVAEAFCNVHVAAHEMSVAPCGQSVYGR